MVAIRGFAFTGIREPPTKNMEARRKIQIVAGGLVLIPVATAILVWHEAGNPSTVEHGLKIAFSWVLAFSLLRRAAWARWLVGVLSVLSLVVSLQVIPAWSEVEPVVRSWVGIWMLMVAIFYLWIACTLLIDRSVIACFKQGETTGKQPI